MDIDVISELLKLYEDMDTKNNWGIDPDEAVQITLTDEETYLTKKTVDPFVNNVIDVLEGIAYERMGSNTKFNFSLELKESIYGIIEHSPYALRVPRKN